MITGTYKGGSPHDVRIEVGDRIQFVDIADIVRIEFDTDRQREERETLLAGWLDRASGLHELSYSDDRRSGLGTELSRTDIHCEPG